MLAFLVQKFTTQFRNDLYFKCTFLGMIKKQFPLKSNFPFANATQKINFKLATKTCLYIQILNFGPLFLNICSWNDKLKYEYLCPYIILGRGKVGLSRGLITPPSVNTGGDLKIKTSYAKEFPSLRKLLNHLLLIVTNFHNQIF